MSGDDGHKITVPRFSSFPAGPSFDSFPVASTSKSRAEATQSTSDDEAGHDDRKRKSKHRDDKDKRKRHRDKSRTDSDREHTRSGKTNGDNEVRDRQSKDSKRRSRSGSRTESRSRPRKDENNSTSQYYNVPNLALGEVPTLSRRVDNNDIDIDPAYAALPDYKLYVLDGKGDQDVRMYGRLYRGSIPKYRRIGFGHVVGLPGEFKITLESAKEGDHLDVVAGRDFSKGASLRDRSVRSKLTDRSFKRLIVAPTTKATQSSIPSAIQLDANTDYIQLPQSKSAREKVAALEHEEGQDYRSVAGQIKPSDIKDDDQWDELEENEEDGAESFDDYLKRRNVEFERHLKTDPNDTKTWLELVEFQDVVHNAISDSTQSAKRVVSSITRRALAEIKISILQRALEKAGNENSTDLHLAMMKYGSDIWDTKELMRRWMELLRSKPEEMKVWLEYLTFRQTNATVFSVQEVVDVYADCMQRIAKSILRNPRGSRARAKLEENYLYLFLRVCLLLRQADYAERALAAFQALIEFNFYMPDRHRAEVQAAPSELRPVDNALEDLELFWDSEIARIGETSSLGWCNTPDTALPPDSITPGNHQKEVKDRVEDSDPFESWATGEREASRAKRRPTRTTDSLDEDEDDPYATILFSDLRPLLFVVSSPDARSQLLYSFLFYLGLPLTPPDTASTSRLASDTFLHADDFSSSFAPHKRAAFWPTPSTDEFLRALIPFDIIGGQAMEPVRTSAISDPFQPPFRKFPMSPDSLFPSQPRWFCLLDQKEYMQDLDLPFIRNTLSQLRLVSKDIFLTLAYFSLEASISGKGAVKAAKTVLKNDSKNLLFWDAYARIERSNGNLKAARNVYMQALSLSQSFEEKEKMDTPLLWRAWTELEWEDGRHSAALAVIVASATASVNSAMLANIANDQEVPAPSPAGILRARQYYRRLLDTANADDSPQSLFRHRISITICLALLEYLSNGLDGSNTIMETQIKQLRSEEQASAEEEEARALQAKIAFRHTQTKTAFRPGILREILETALQTFPNNSIFLSLHLFNELRTRIENRVRRVLDEIVLKAERVTSEGWLFAIYAELHLNSRAYNLEAVRSLFERAVDHPNSRSSLSLWSLYIDFELRQKEAKRAKRLLHRALAECPWATDLYLMPFAQPFRQVYRSVELREIHRLMLEKGIRLHKSLETAVAGWQSEASEDGMDMDALETEDSMYAQKQAAERLRLMPV